MLRCRGIKEQFSTLGGNGEWNPASMNEEETNSRCGVPSSSLTLSASDEVKQDYCLDSEHFLIVWITFSRHLNMTFK
ncbi:hypothetical protein Y1Q_0017459 [Alligator mississippiensis]|uniref:Uncharacterized protein n=1 Tax=Alligator mississippiensis TaxID=8496 RepID=A0A151P222_ALLMI|nr:hypothetical protein Y1Q_0017459 [Alligator mississippiensis]